MTEGVKVVLNPDQKAVALKTMKDMLFAVKQLHDWISEDGLTEEMAGILPSLIESHFVDIAKQLNYESVLTKEKEERHQQIREANTRIRELEKQLGESKPIGGLKEQLRFLASTVSDWWNKYGFHHVSEESFTEYGHYTAKFCFMLDHISMFSDTPETDKRTWRERIQELIAEGWDIIFTDGKRSPQLVDNDNNRSRLVNLIQSRFPSAKIIRTRNWRTDDEKVFIYRDIEVYIYDLRDIPEPEMMGAE
ncbi:hypothetical protein KIH86_03820 [Paenibacillus sp. HN-1]|uniref:hypothetical protein n=1 Tax=Paenibacillus TaxID=44249 RepID=UPI001CA7B72B|nr:MULTISPECIES: hypothetical protein [Paenibacillus]MBY9079536.1 hypothetical protein [Paenibacillus sp. CGMCC 1.18879]MBY9083357.1 hypothetical protein [Paenibacillus sinensis]